MKLRNKNTGEIGVINLKVYGPDTEYVYDTLETLYEEWEDNIQLEPLIKDGRMRKAVRLWAELNKFSVFIINNKWRNVFEIRGLTDLGDGNGCSIYFKGSISRSKNITCSIEELCGEEE